MTDPVLLGLGTAACWGVADFVARFLGRAIGALPALTLVTLFGAAELAVLMAARGEPLPPLGAASAAAWAAAAATVAAMWAFYEALCRAPLVVVAPLVGAYPAWSLVLGVALLGLRPGAAEWAAMAAVILGMALVARGGGAAAGHPGAVWLALGSGAVFGAAVLLAQQAGVAHGSAATVYYTRVLGGGMLLALLLGRARALPPPRWLATAAAQAGADTGGYLFLYAAAAGLEAAVATVVSSAFGAVSVLLARIFLKERIRPPQVGGMALVFGGVAWLAGA